MRLKEIPMFALLMLMAEFRDFINHRALVDIPMKGVILCGPEVESIQWHLG